MSETGPGDPTVGSAEAFPFLGGAVETDWTQAAKPYRDSAAANLAVATSALRNGEYEFAEKRAQQAIELDPSSIRSRLLYARTLLAAGKASSAR